MLDGRHDLTVCGIVTFEFVRHQPTWFTTLAFQEAMKEADRGLLVASALHENINGIAILVDRSSQILLFAMDGHKYFIKMPRITESALAFFEFTRVDRPKLLTPLANRFIGHRDAALGE